MANLAHRVSGLAGVLAAASPFIYLTHWQVWPELERCFAAPVVFAGAVAVGVGAWWLVERATGWIEPRVRRHGGRAGRVAGAEAHPLTEEVADHGRT